MTEFYAEWGNSIIGASLLMFLGSLWFVSWLIIRIPSDYFLKHDALGTPSDSVFHYPLLILRNVIGAFLILFGFAMLVLPGQGVVTILIGLSLMSFPGKRRIVTWILGLQSVRRTMNWIRGKASKPPLQFEPASSSESSKTRF